MAKCCGTAFRLHGVMLLISAAAVLGLTNISKATPIFPELLSALVIFGDSTVDAGNNNYLATVVKSDFQPYGRDFQGGVATGRFCDGLLVTDYVASKLGLPLGLPYLAPNAHGTTILTGINFASSASGWFDNTALHFNVVGLTQQFEWYKNWKQEVISLVGQGMGNEIFSKALYVFSTGSNDWVNNYYINPHLMKQYTPDTYTTFLLGLARTYIQELYNLGGRNIGVLGLPPLGCLPSQITLHGNGYPGCINEYNAVAIKYNLRLESMINDMKQNMHGSRLVYLDIYTLLYNVVQNPQPYGFTVTQKGCCGTGNIETAILCNRDSIGTCKDAYPYVWWDSFHPTTHFYSLLADELYQKTLPILFQPPQP